MRYMKNVLGMLFGIVFAVGLYGCEFNAAKNTPTEVVSQSLESIKSGDSESILNLLDDDIPIKFKRSVGLKKLLPSSTEKMTELLKNINYKVNSEKINGYNGEVNVTVIGPEFDKAFDELMSNIVKDIQSGELGKGDLDLKKISAKYDNELSELLDNVKKSEWTGNIELEKKRGQWVIDSEDELCRLAVNINPDDYDDKYDISSSDLLKLLGK